VEIPPEWSEATLPAGLAAWSDGEEPSPLPGDMAFPAEALAILRHEVVNGEHVILFLSSDYELPGETPAYGLWLARTEGGRWTAPTYLGLQHYFPYVATRGSRLPLIEDGHLQIEVKVREIAPASITFPPVAMSTRREADGVVIRALLADLERDRDWDGLTDIAERRLGLEPSNADTDGDGLADGADPLPLTSAGPASDVQTALAKAILGEITGARLEGMVLQPRSPDETPDEAVAAVIGGPRPYKSLETVILVADPALFAGLDLPFRLLVYTPEQVERLTAGAAPFYPPTLTIYSSLDGLKHLVNWSARWRGGSFTVRCPANGEACTVEEKSNWIT
jgi:hypothetical protein